MKLSQYGTLATTSSYSLLESRNVTDMTLNFGCYGQIDSSHLDDVQCMLLFPTSCTTKMSSVDLKEIIKFFKCKSTWNSCQTLIFLGHFSVVFLIHVLHFKLKHLPSSNFSNIWCFYNFDILPFLMMTNVVCMDSSGLCRKEFWDKSRNAPKR